MKLLVVGSNGQLGWALEQEGRRRGHNIIGLDLPEFSVTDQTQVARQVEKIKPQMVVNASAYTAVDRAESEAKMAYAVNQTGPMNLATACTINGIPMIHISTDYVFNGDKKKPYLETDAVAPTGTYGKSKAAGEDAVRNELKNHIIIRTAWLYGVMGHNFVKAMLSLGKEHETIKVVADQQGCPTYAADLADAIFDITGQVLDGKKEWGTYHYCGKGSATWYEFARAIFEIGKSITSLKVREVTPISTDEYPTPAKRPANSVLDCDQIQKVFKVNIRPWKASLSEMLTLYLSDPNFFNG